MNSLARLIVPILCCLSSPVVAAGFFDGYSPSNAADQETMNYAADLEGRAFNQFDTIRVVPTLTVAGASTMTASDFRDGVAASIRMIHNVPSSCESQTPTNVGTNSGWTLYNDAKRTGEFWTNRLYYKQPASDPATWKEPIVVINDGMGVLYSTGISSRGYAGENVAQILLDDGHPVLVMALKGMDDKYFSGGWGISGLEEFEAFVKARGDSAVSIWIRDAYDAVCLMQQWFPGKSIGTTGVSKSGIIAASAAILNFGIDKVYLASGFSAFESKFSGINTWSYGFGERAKYERNSVVLALWDRAVRLSYSSTNDDISYRIEAAEGRVMNAVNAQRSSWSKPLISEFSSAPSHYYDATDVATFFSN